MKVLLLTLLTCLSLFGLEREWSEMNDRQKNNILMAYTKSKEFDLGYTMAAIMWQESLGGKYKVNLQDPSCGAFHNNINTIMARHSIENTSFNRNRICQMLIDNTDIALAEAITEIQYWLHERNGSFIEAWASYNGGWKMNKSYAENIRKKIVFLKKIIKD
jgi:hypothetical protein